MLVQHRYDLLTRRYGMYFRNASGMPPARSGEVVNSASTKEDICEMWRERFGESSVPDSGFETDENDQRFFSTSAKFSFTPERVKRTIAVTPREKTHDVDTCGVVPDMY